MSHMHYPEVVYNPIGVSGFIAAQSWANFHFYFLLSILTFVHGENPQRSKNVAFFRPIYIYAPRARALPVKFANFSETLGINPQKHVGL